MFEGRANEAHQLGLPPRVWPPNLIVHAHWAADYARAAASAGTTLPLDEAVAEVNTWVTAIDDAL